MDSDSPIGYRYNHDDRVDVPPLVKILGLGAIVVFFSIFAQAIMASGKDKAGAILFVAVFIGMLVVAYALYASGYKKMYLGVRRIVCGNSVLYYGNISRVVVHRDAGWMVLESATGSSLRIVEDKFPTSARKPEKIKKNRSEKFNRVVEKVLARVAKLAPEVDIQNLGTRSAPSGTQ